MLQMMVPLKRTLELFALILSIVILMACSVVTPLSTATVTTETPTLPPVSPTPTILPVTPTKTSALPISSAPDGLRMAYVINGNLYFQDGTKPPVQLTNSGEDRSPLRFSESGEKIFFFRGRIPKSLYSIRIDGSDEKALVTNEQLISFSSKYDESTLPCDPVLVPRTSFLLFHTCSHPDEFTTILNDDLFMVDTNTKQIKRLFALGQGGLYYVSPDGSMLAVDRLGYVDITGLDGKILHHKVATYTFSEPIPLIPYVYWESDANGLVLVLPTNTHYDTAPDPRYEVWYYSLATRATTLINLASPPVGTDPIRAAPDGNWILYTNYEDGLFYLGDLRNGYTQSYQSLQTVSGYEWSADSTHFVYGVRQPSGRGISMGSVKAPPSFIGKGDFIGWLDASRYLYINDRTILMAEIGGETTLILSNVPMSLFPGNPAGFIFAYESLSK